MGPGNKSRPRAQYIKYRLRVLRELGIAAPPQEVIDRMLDESMSEVQVDAIFLDIITKAP